MSETTKQADSYKRLREAADKAGGVRAAAQELLDQYNCDRGMTKKLKSIVVELEEVRVEVDGGARDATGPVLEISTNPDVSWMDRRC